MKKRCKTMIIIIAIILFLFGTFITTDTILANNNQKPVFAICIDSYEDGGSKKYLGLFHLVYDLHYENPEMTEE